MTDMLNEKIKHQTFIKAAPEKVFDTITSADGWNAFFTQGLELDNEPDGKIVWRWKDFGPNFYTTEAPGKVLQTERLQFWCSSRPCRDGI